MKELLNQNRLFFLSAGTYLVLGFVVVSLFPMGAIELEVYKNHNPFANSIFFLFNFFGDGYFLLICLPAILLFVSPRSFLITGFTVLFTFLIISILKNYIFPDADRPLRYFGEVLLPYYIDGMERNQHSSFPSGHSGQAMAIAASLSAYFRKSYWSILLLLTAIMVTWSRVYLMQHFLVDTLAGASIALLISLLMFNFRNYSFSIKGMDIPLHQTLFKSGKK